MATFAPLDPTEDDFAEVSLPGGESCHEGWDDAKQLLFGDEHTWTNGVWDRPSRRLHLVYHHLFGSQGQQLRDVIAGIDRDDAYAELLKLDWHGLDLDQVLELVSREAQWRQGHLAAHSDSDRIPLFRGLHAPSPLAATGALAPHQRWAQTVMEKGCADGTLELVEDDFLEPVGHVLDVEPFTHTVDNWTPTLKFANHWARSPGNWDKFCMVMAAQVDPAAVLFWRIDASGTYREVIVRGGAGRVNVYFQKQPPKASWPTEDDIDNWDQR